MSAWAQILLTAVVAVAGSSGFWAWMQFKGTKRTLHEKLSMGLAYDKIITMGMSFIQRGWITQDEYEDYRTYLYDPYKALGGNGVTERVMAEISSLPLRPRAQYSEIIKEVKMRGSSDEPTTQQHEDFGILAH